MSDLLPEDLQKEVDALHPRGTIYRRKGACPGCGKLSEDLSDYPVVDIGCPCGTRYRLIGTLEEYPLRRGDKVERVPSKFFGPKLCWFCRWFAYTNAESDWSDVTPGSSFGLECYKGVWSFDAYQTSQKEFGEMLSRAETCEHYEPKDDL